MSVDHLQAGLGRTTLFPGIRARVPCPTEADAAAFDAPRLRGFPPNAERTDPYFAQEFATEPGRLYVSSTKVDMRYSFSLRGSMLSMDIMQIHDRSYSRNDVRTADKLKQRPIPEDSRRCQCRRNEGSRGYHS